MKINKCHTSKIYNYNIQLQITSQKTFLLLTSSFRYEPETFFSSEHEGRVMEKILTLKRFNKIQRISEQRTWQ